MAHKKDTQELTPAQAGRLLGRLAQCAGIARGAMMAHTVLMHDIGMGLVRPRHLTGAVELSRQARHMLEGLERELLDVMCPPAPASKARKAKKQKK